MKARSTVATNQDLHQNDRLRGDAFAEPLTFGEDGRFEQAVGPTSLGPTYREPRPAVWPMAEREEANLFFHIALASDPDHVESFEAIAAPTATAFVGEAIVIRLADGKEEPASIELMANTHDCPHCRQPMPERKKTGEVKGSTFTPNSPGLYRLRVVNAAGQHAFLFVGAVPRETAQHLFIRIHQTSHLRGEERSPRERVSMLRSLVRDIAHSGVLETLTPARPLPSGFALNAYG